jgi:hypothetical protein
LGKSFPLGPSTAAIGAVEPSTAKQRDMAIGSRVADVEADWHLIEEGRIVPEIRADVEGDLSGFLHLHVTWQDQDDHAAGQNHWVETKVLALIVISGFRLLAFFAIEIMDWELYQQSQAGPWKKPDSTHGG